MSECLHLWCSQNIVIFRNRFAQLSSKMTLISSSDFRWWITILLQFPIATNCTLRFSFPSNSCLIISQYSSWSRLAFQPSRTLFEVNNCGVYCSASTQKYHQRCDVPIMKHFEGKNNQTELWKKSFTTEEQKCMLWCFNYTRVGCSGTFRSSSR